MYVETSTAAVDRLAGILGRRIVSGEEYARESAQIAKILRRDGHHAVAGEMLNLRRHQRIRGMEGRANLSALTGGCPG